MLYNLEFIEREAEDVLKIGFVPSVSISGDDLVKYIAEQLPQVAKEHTLYGRILKINGSVSVPGAMVLAAYFKNRYKAIAMFDPKMSEYIVVISTSHDHKVGSILEDF